MERPRVVTQTGSGRVPDFPDDKGRINSGGGRSSRSHNSGSSGKSVGGSAGGSIGGSRSHNSGGSTGGSGGSRVVPGFNPPKQPAWLIPPEAHDNWNIKDPTGVKRLPSHSRPEDFRPDDFARLTDRDVRRRAMHFTSRFRIPGLRSRSFAVGRKRSFQPTATFGVARKKLRSDPKVTITADHILKEKRALPKGQVDKSAADWKSIRRALDYFESVGIQARAVRTDKTGRKSPDLIVQTPEGQWITVEVKTPENTKAGWKFRKSAKRAAAQSRAALFIVPEGYSGPDPIRELQNATQPPWLEQLDWIGVLFPNGKLVQLVHG